VLLLLLLQVYEAVAKNSVLPVLSGVSGTIFAYGVTSSGKTHTMMGSQADVGVVPRAIRTVFKAAEADTDRCVRCCCTFVHTADEARGAHEAPRQ
jgi:Kinesin motor domain